MNFRAYRVHEEAGGARGRLETVRLEELSSGEVVIRVCYSGVNYKDALAATGRNKIIRAYPRIPGIDAAGIVESSATPGFQSGDRVIVTGFDLGTAHDGGYAEMVRVPAAWAVPLPAGLSLYEAMAIGTAGFTVGLCLQRLEENGQRTDAGPILVSGATGGVGSIAIDVLSARGYAVTALTGKMKEQGYLRTLGAAEILDRNTRDLGTQPLEKAIWGGAIDNVGGEVLAWLTRTTKPWGNICSVGLAGGTELHTTVMPFILRGVSLIGITASGCPVERRARVWQRLATDWKPRHLDKIVTRVAGLEELDEIFAAMLNGAQTGRTVIRIAGE
ncbi:MAG TPA: oxidoreductase [Gammaproteobacteria bacterium]|nr:oxidoreductase [Gammaproteobacteria bacterium]